MKKIIEALGGPVVSAVIGLLLVLTVGGGVFGGILLIRQGGEIARLNKMLEDERKEAATRAKVITQEDMERLLQQRDLEIARRFDAFAETLRVIASSNRPGGPVIIERDVRAPAPVPGPPGAPGRPGADGRDGRDGTPGSSPAAGQPGQLAGTPTGPLIPADRAPAAREAAIERILAHFVPGSLLNCDTIGLEPNTVEFLRDPEGRLLSTARCVWRVQDQVTLTPPSPVTGPTFPRWEGRILAGHDSTLQWIAGARLTHNLNRTWAVELEGGRSFAPPGSWYWRVVGTWRAF